MSADPAPNIQQTINPASTSQHHDIIDKNIDNQLENIMNLINEQQQANLQKLQEIENNALATRKILIAMQNRFDHPDKLKDLSDDIQNHSETESDAYDDNFTTVTEKELSYWVETSFIIDPNPTVTSQAAEEAEQSLQNFPGIYLNKMQCSDRFCRASLSHVNGENIAAEDMFGQPPFLTDGFTITKQDGTVLFYFSQPGESILDLRESLLAESDDY
jgi:phage-related tail protein